MGRKLIFSAILAAGLVQVAPAIAQTQDQPPEQDRAAAATPATTAAEATAPIAETRASAPIAEARASEPAPASIAEAKAPATDRARELAEKDLAAAPPEEIKPVVVDPGDARRALARARQAVAQAEQAEQQRAAAEPSPAEERRPARAEARLPAAEPRPLAADADEPAPPPVRERRPVYADQARAPAYPADDRRGDDAQDDRAIYANTQDRADDGVEDAAAADVAEPRDLRGRQARQVYADEADPAPAPRDVRERQARQVYGEEGPAAAPRALPPAHAQRPVYADDDRDARAAYPDADADADAGYPVSRRDPAGAVYADVPQPGARYAIVDRSLRSAAGRDDADQQWGGREPSPACDADRADRLLRQVRRKADFERIDGRAAGDIEDEIGHAGNLQRSYCASGMNDWREQRLDRIYAQIEDRIRYEEDRRWQR